MQETSLCAATAAENSIVEISSLLHSSAGAAMSSPERQALIKEIYDDPETGFGSLREMCQKAIAKDPGIRYVDVKAFLDRYARQTQAKYLGSNS